MPATQLALSLVGLVRCFFRSNNTEQVQEKYRNGYGYGYGTKNHISSTGMERVRVLSKNLVRKKERVRVILRSGEYVTGTGFFELKLRYGYGYGYGRISILEVRVRIPYPYPYFGVWSIHFKIFRNLGRLRYDLSSSDFLFKRFVNFPDSFLRR